MMYDYDFRRPAFCLLLALLLSLARDRIPTWDLKKQRVREWSPKLRPRTDEGCLLVVHACSRQFQTYHAIYRVVVGACRKSSSAV